MSPGLISLFVPSFRGGGAEGAVVRLANQLAESDQLVEVVTLSEAGPWKSALGAGVSTANLEVPRALVALPALIRYLERRRPAVFVSNLPHLSVISILARGLSGVDSRVVVLEHNDISARLESERGMRNHLLVGAMRATYSRADRILAVSQGAAESLTSRLHLSPNSVGVLPNGIDISTVRETSLESVEHPWFDNHDRPVLLAAGRLVRQKGFDLLLNSLAQLRGDLPARLIILGEGPERGRLLDLAQELGLREAVEFPGYKATPYAFMRSADAFVLSSRYEGFGVVLLEAMAVGCPVAAFDCPSGPAEVLGDGAYGLLAAPGDTTALAEAMKRLVTDAELAAGYRTRGRERAEQYDIRTIADRFLREIEQLGHH